MIKHKFAFPTCDLIDFWESYQCHVCLGCLPTLEYYIDLHQYKVQTIQDEPEDFSYSLGDRQNRAF